MCDEASGLSARWTRSACCAKRRERNVRESDPECALGLLKLLRRDLASREPCLQRIETEVGFESAAWAERQSRASRDHEEKCEDHPEDDRHADEHAQEHDKRIQGQTSE